MKKLFMLGVVAAALLVPAASRAQFTLGARVGYAPAMGDAAKDEKLSDGVKSQIPIQLDAAYKVTPDIAVGAYFAYGIGQIGSAVSDVCDISGIDCSARVLRFGVQGLYSFNAVSKQFVPWAGLGAGYEIGSLEVSGGGATAKTTYRGFEFLNLQGGADYKVSEQFSVGPYVMLSIGQYSKAKIENSVDPGLDFDGDIPDKAMHEWLGFGVRGKFDL